MSEKHINKSPLPQHEGRLGVGIIPQGYKQTSIGIIPQDWEVVRLGEVCLVQSGGTPPKNKKSYWENGTIKWLGSSVCKNLHYVDEITDYITQKGLDNSSAKIFKQGTTLIALVGATIGKIAYLNFDASTNQNIAGIYPQNEKVLNRIFLFYISLMLYKEFEKLSSDKFKMANLSFIKSLQIPLPPLKEQEKIARILGVWDSALDTLANLIKAKRKYKTALMQRLLTPPKDIDCDTKSQITPSLAEGARGWVNPRNDKFMDCHENPYGFAGFASDSRNDNSPPRHTTSHCHTDSPLCHTERSEVSKSKGVDFVDTSAFSKPQYDKILDSCNASPLGHTASCCHTASTYCHTEGVARSIQKDNLQDNAVCLDSSLSAKAQNDREKLHNFKNKPNESSLRFAGFSDKWQEFRLGNICKIKKGEQLNKIYLSNDMEGKFAVINGGILPSGYTDKFNAHENTITISEGGNSCGFVNLILEKFWSGGHCYTITDNKADTSFLFHFLKFKEKFIQDLRVGSGLPNIQKKDIENFKIFIPTLAEQKKIAQVLSACDKEIETLNLKFECLKEQKRGLMQQLLSGKVRVKC